MTRLDSLSQVIGHDWLIGFLTEHLKNGTLPRFIIFDGPEGCGKTTIATLLALNLVYGLAETDEKLTAYKELCENNRSTNYIKKFKLSVENGKEAAKDVLAEMHECFTAGHKKVLIGDEAHNLSEGAQDVFLEDSEFLPKDTYLFLLTTDVTKLKPALRSRATPIHIPALKLSDMLKVLKREVAARNLHIQAEDATLQLIADWSNCRPRTGLSLLSAFANNSDVSAEVVRNLVGYLDVSDVLPLLKSLSGSITFGLAYITEMTINTTLVSIVSEIIRVKSGSMSYRLRMNEVTAIKTELVEVPVETLITFLYGLTATQNLTRTSVIHAYLRAHKNMKELANTDSVSILQTEIQQHVSEVKPVHTNFSVPTLDDLLANSAVIEG